MEKEGAQSEDTAWHVKVLHSKILWNQCSASTMQNFKVAVQRCTDFSEVPKENSDLKTHCRTVLQNMHSSFILFGLLQVYGCICACMCLCVCVSGGGTMLSFNKQFKCCQNTTGDIGMERGMTQKEAKAKGWLDSDWERTRGQETLEN